jgi:electron-transferring-flavoprotein dehydrogenase
VEYGARALNEGGYHSIPEMSFPGGLIAGCSAGFMNVARIKGAHNAMKSGIVAAETIFEEVNRAGTDSLFGKCLESFDANIKSSWIIEDLKPFRNF